MAVTHDFECLAHGLFTARGSSAKPPRCPRGCSPSLVKLVFLQAPGFVSSRTRTGDRLVREMATMQGLSDISTSPSRPGGSVAHRNRMKQMRLRGPKGREYPELAGAVGVDIGKYLGAMTEKGNTLTQVGLGRPYAENEWKKDPETGKVKHVAGPSATVPVPTGTTGVSVERVKEGVRRENSRRR